MQFRRPKSSSVIVTILVLIPCALEAQATLTGVVRRDSSRTPIADAEILIPGMGLTVRTNVSGEYVVTGIPAGEHAVSVRHVGVVGQTIKISFTNNETIERDFVLTSLPLVLDTVATVGLVSSARMREFEERRRIGIGHFITQDDLARQHGRLLADVLRRVPGLVIQPGTGSEQWVANSRGQSTIVLNRTPDRFARARGAKAACYADIYVDGTLVYGGRKDEPLFDINQLIVQDIAGIEYYAGAAQLPARFQRTGATCGALLVWTRAER
ncbi:MAG TPA: carboxypeptidase-like regulatory domain-containing protein [Gemmatimonadaceae bacterium]|nr:carboxypeptidase-like regulatory domain-containing protein [Gemmatimonadaceae bacterium]